MKKCATWLGYYWDPYLCDCIKKQYFPWMLNYEDLNAKIDDFGLNAINSETGLGLFIFNYLLEIKKKGKT